MSINKLIKDSLKVLNIPVSFQSYKGNRETYITFFCYNERGETYAEDEEIQTAIYIQVDVWSKYDYTEIVNQTRIILENNGFRRTTSIDLYESDTGVYHKGMRFIYIKNN